jgi:DNA-binding CsgD family transcriptional regulator
VKRPSGCPFTKRQWEAIELLADGLSLREIAARFGRAHASVRTLLWNARKRVGAANNAGLLAECYDQGWLATPVARLEHEEEAGEWPTVTPAQRAYLTVFDRMLRTPFGSEAERRALLEMRYMLGAMCIEKRIDMPGSTRVKCEAERPVLALAA